jgi:alkanesulfonate monooxygenase SsuD/methylene tetrahydromethanopterin reductase-like flavin-dependent oxidoreductase (luciferase family)
MQSSTYRLAAEKGIGVMALGVSAPSILAPHVQAYHEKVRQAQPVGAFINDQWLSSTMAFCDEDNKAGRELAAQSLKTFFGPDRPYLKDQVNVYEHLIEQWGGVPEHLQANFARYLKKDGLTTGEAPEVDLSGGSGVIAQAIWNQLDADTLCDRGVLVAGDPESCLKGIRIHEAIGVDQLQFLMATETISHQKVMTSLELFGKYVIPELQKTGAASGSGSA